MVLLCYPSLFFSPPALNLHNFLQAKAEPVDSLTKRLLQLYAVLNFALNKSNLQTFITILF